MIKLSKRRLSKIDKLKLDVGSHKSITDGACIMEMVAYVAGEPWSDHPQCACPILTEYAIRLNDRFNDKHRQQLKPFIIQLVGTKASDVEQIDRKRLIRWRNVTVTYPLLLDLFKMTELAEKLRGLGNNLKDMAKAKELLSENREAIRANANADAYAYANADAYADAYANANAYAYADAYAYANAYAYAYADADAYANANAYADSLKEKLVTVSLETLQMAIDIGKDKK